MLNAVRTVAAGCEEGRVCVTGDRRVPLPFAAVTVLLLDSLSLLSYLELVSVCSYACGLSSLPL